MRRRGATAGPGSVADHYARRPLLHLAGLGAEIVETERFCRGVLERVPARRI